MTNISPEPQTRMNLAAFDEFQRSNRPMLFAYVLHMMRSPEDAEDVSQEAFTRLWNWMSDPAQAVIESPWPWLKCCAKNLCIDRIRRRHRVHFISFEGSDDGSHEAGWERQIPDLKPDALNQMLTHEMRARVREAICSLPKHHRETIALFYGCELEVKDIAQRLGVAEGTIKSRLFRAREHLERTLGSYVRS